MIRRSFLELSVLCVVLALACAGGNQPGASPPSPSPTSSSSSQRAYWYHKIGDDCPIFAFRTDKMGDDQRAFKECASTTGGDCVREEKDARTLPKCPGTG